MTSPVKDAKQAKLAEAKAKADAKVAAMAEKEKEKKLKELQKAREAKEKEKAKLQAEAEKEKAKKIQDMAKKKAEKEAKAAEAKAAREKAKAEKAAAKAAEKEKEPDWVEQVDEHGNMEMIDRNKYPHEIQCSHPGCTNVRFVNTSGLLQVTMCKYHARQERRKRRAGKMKEKMKVYKAIVQDALAQGLFPEAFKKKFGL